MQKATIFNPIDNSLEIRVKAIRAVQQEFDNIQAVLKISKADGFDSVYGTPKELNYAFKLTKNSLKEAVNSLSLSDLEIAKNDKLLSFDEYKNMVLHKNKEKLENIRSNQNQQNIEHSKDIDI